MNKNTMKIKEIKFNGLTDGMHPYGLDADLTVITDNNKQFNIPMSDVLSYCGEDPLANEHALWIVEKIKKGEIDKNKLMAKANISVETLNDWLEVVENGDVNEFNGKNLDGCDIYDEDINYAVDGYSEEFLHSDILINTGIGDWILEEVDELIGKEVYPADPERWYSNCTGLTIGDLREIIDK